MAKQYLYKTTREYTFGLKINTGLKEALVFTNKQGREVFRLTPNGNLSINMDFSFDGASPKIKLFCMLMGAWDGEWCHVKGQPKLFEATMKHDALCQIVAFCKKKGIKLNLTQLQVDQIFKTDMIKVNFKYTDFYYFMVRMYDYVVRW